IERQQYFGINEFIIIASSRGEPAVLVSAIVRYGIPVIIDHISYEIGFLQDMGHPREIIIKRLHLRPPHPLVIIMGTGVVSDSGVACASRIMRRPMDDHLAHPFRKSTIPVMFHFERSLLPVLKRREGFHFNYTVSINMGSRRHLLDDPKDIHPLLVEKFMVNPELTPGNIQTLAQGFQRFNRNIVKW